MKIVMTLDACSLKQVHLDKENWLQPLPLIPEINVKLETHLRSPSTSGRSLVIAMTKANSVTKHVMKATGELHLEKYHMALDIMSSLNVPLQ